MDFVHNITFCGKQSLDYVVVTERDLCIYNDTGFWSESFVSPNGMGGAN